MVLLLVPDVVLRGFIVTLSDCRSTPTCAPEVTTLVAETEFLIVTEDKVGRLSFEDLKGL